MKLSPRVLLIDDDPVSVMAVKDTLTQAGYEVETACDGEHGLQMALSGRFRVVITDWIMPGMSGPELCQRIRSSDTSQYMYILFLTQRLQRVDIIEGLRAGADDYLGKPVTSGELLARLMTAERLLSLITRDVTIFALAKLAESRDSDTGAHLERVRHYCRVLAQTLRELPGHRHNIDDEFVRLIYLTSPLHDIGKVGIPDCVLLKPERLTDEEFAIMKTHTTIGANTLEAALAAHPDALYLQMARDIALTHHERYDGGGYPIGLKAEEIPLSGRIVAIADVYDALTSQRVYKQAYPHDVALKTIVEATGQQFDPVVVEAFVSCEREICNIRERFADHRATFTTDCGPVRMAA